MIYFSPIFAEKVRSFEEQGEAHSCVLNRAEISNTVFLLGNLTCEPIQWYVEKKPYTRYQLAINRKYCPKGLQEVTERTDYPWVYSFGQQAVDEPQAQGLVGAEALAQHGDLQGATQAHQARQRPGRAHVAAGAQVDVGQVELGSLGGEHEVAHQHQ